MRTERDQFEIRFAIIQEMEDGPEKDQAMEQLFQDYPGLTADAQDRVNKGFEMATQGIAQGTLAGPSSNPFTQYVGANPLEHAARGVEKFMGHRQMRQGREDLAKLSADKQAAGTALGNAALQQGQAQALRQQPPAMPGPKQTVPGGMDMTPEEEEEYWLWRSRFGR